MNEIKKFEQEVYCTDCGKYVGTSVHYGQYAPNMTAECPRGCQLYVIGRCYAYSIERKERRKK